MLTFWTGAWVRTSGACNGLRGRLTRTSSWVICSRYRSCWFRWRFARDWDVLWELEGDGVLAVVSVRTRLLVALVEIAVGEVCVNSDVV